MNSLGKRIRLAMVALVCTGAIAACRQAPEVTEQPTPVPESTPTTVAPEATPSPSPTAAAPDPAPSPQATAQPNVAPPAPLPAECNNPQTQAAMNTCAQAEYQQADAQLNQVYQAVKGSLNADRQEKLVSAELDWITFRDRFCDFVQAQFAGGSIQPTVYYGCLTELTRDRTGILQQPSTSSRSYEAADQELNATYQNLRGALSDAEKQQLTTAQLAWISYRDAHCAYALEATNTCLAKLTEQQTGRLLEQFESRSF